MTLEHIFMLCARVVTATMIVPIIVAVIYSKRINRSQRIFFYYLIGALLIALFMQAFIWATGAFKGFFIPILKEWKITNTFFISVYNYLFNFLFVGWYFNSVFSSERTQKNIRTISIALFGLCIIHNFFLQDWRLHNSAVATTSAFFCMLLPLFHLRFVYRTLTEITIQKNPYFWIDLGLLVPNTLVLFVHFAGDTLSKTDMDLYFQVSIAKYIFVILAQFFFAYSFYLARYSKYLPEKW